MTSISRLAALVIAASLAALAVSANPVPALNDGMLCRVNQCQTGSHLPDSEQWDTQHCMHGRLT